MCECIDAINDIIMDKLPGDSVNYLAIDRVMDQEDHVHYPQEFLNLLNPCGLSLVGIRWN